MSAATQATAVATVPLFTRGPGNLASYVKLLKPDAGWTTERVLVISPYVEKIFFRGLAATLRPKSMSIIVDDSCRPEDVEAIEAGVRDGNKGQTTLYVRQGSAPGLVHLKVFFVRERSSSGVVRYRLLCGSANATRQGFSGNVNAELLFLQELQSDVHVDVIDWMLEVALASKSTETVHISRIGPIHIGNGSSLFLPGFRVCNLGLKASGFDLWMQRGKLLAEYRPDASFLHVPIPLKEALPSGALASRAKKRGFSGRETRQLRFYYLGDDFRQRQSGQTPAGAPSNGGTGHWRSRYFVWTNLGWWCSEECDRLYRSTFRRSGHVLRKRVLKRLSDLRVGPDRTVLQDQFIKALRKLHTDFGDNASKYLETTASGSLNVAFYKQRFIDKLDQDIRLADDEEYANRFVHGYEMNDVPRFRADMTGWRSFVESFGRQILFGELKTRQTSKVRNAIIEALDGVNVDATAFALSDDLIAALRDYWTEFDEEGTGPITVGDAISDYSR